MIGAIAVFALIGASSTDTLVQLYREPKLQLSGFHITFLLNALTSDTMAPFVAIVAILPFSGNYVDEVKSKFAGCGLPPRPHHCLLPTGRCCDFGRGMGCIFRKCANIPAHGESGEHRGEPVSCAYRAMCHPISQRWILGGARHDYEYRHGEQVHCLRLPLRGVLPAGNAL